MSRTSVQEKLDSEHITALESQLALAQERIAALERVREKAKQFIIRVDKAQIHEPWSGFTNASCEEKKAYVQLRDEVEHTEEDRNKED